MIVMLAGPIKHWWDAWCAVDLEWFTPVDQDDPRCPKCSELGELVWGSPEHTRYVEWRDELSEQLVASGHLVYHPHRAFKGEWYANRGEEFAQRVNDLAIKLSDVTLDLTPPRTPSDGTDAERKFAYDNSKWWMPAPPPLARFDAHTEAVSVISRMEALFASMVADA